MIELNEKEQKWVDEIFEKLDKKLSVTAVKLRGRIPYSTNDGFYPDMGEDKKVSFVVMDLPPKNKLYTNSDILAAIKSAAEKGEE